MLLSVIMLSTALLACHCTRGAAAVSSSLVISVSGRSASVAATAAGGAATSTARIATSSLASSSSKSGTSSAAVGLGTTVRTSSVQPASTSSTSAMSRVTSALVSSTTRAAASSSSSSAMSTLARSFIITTSALRSTPPSTSTTLTPTSTKPSPASTTLAAAISTTPSAVAVTMSAVVGLNASAVRSTSVSWTISTSQPTTSANQNKSSLVVSLMTSSFTSPTLMVSVVSLSSVASTTSSSLHVAPSISSSALMTPSVPSSASMAPSVPSASPMAPFVPSSSAPMAPSASSSAPMAPSVPSSAPMAPSVPSSTPMAPSVPSSALMTPSVPSSAPMAPSVPSSAPMAPSVPSSSPMAPSVPSSAPMAPSVPSSAPMVPSVPSSSPMAPFISSSAPMVPLPSPMSSMAGPLQQSNSLKQIWLWAGAPVGVVILVVLGVAILLSVVLIVRRRRKSSTAGVSSPTPDFSTVYAFDPPITGEQNGRYGNSPKSAIYESVHNSLRPPVPPPCQGYLVPFQTSHFAELLTVPNTGTYERPVVSKALTYERPVPSPQTSAPHLENSYEDPRRLRPRPLSNGGVQPQLYEMSMPLPQVQVTIEVSGYERPVAAPHKEEVESSQGSSDEDTAFIRSFDIQNSNDSYWRSSVNCEELRRKVSDMCHEIPREDIQIKAHLGSGEFGVVNRGIWHSQDGLKEVAIKMLPATSSTAAHVKLMQEAAMFAQFSSHPNVVQLYGVCTIGNPLMMIQEFLSKGDLLQMLSKLKTSSEGGPSSDWPSTFLTFCLHIATGMDYLSNQGIVHRDLAARNILVSEDMICKIGDFGMSKDLDEEDHYISRKGKVPFKWTAPEAICTRTYSSMSDVWSYGVVMFEIWSMGQKPYEMFRASSALLAYLEKGGRLPPPPGCPRALYHLMVQCWHREKTSRPLFSRIVHILSSPSSTLLHWSEEDVRTHPQATQLGAPMVAGEGLYLDLQHRYTTKSDVH